ncbi:MAG: hypothetical protein J6U21_14415 [Bacteroidales bacterium]|nr:hypothetical protein [Bacteroidales bacterium]
MKKNFLRILPIAAAVLLATSCSKDNDDNTIVENNAAQENVGNTVVDNNAAQEDVEAVHDFALTVSNSQSLSKLSLVGEVGGNGTKDLKFDVDDVLNIFTGEWDDMGTVDDEEDDKEIYYASVPLTADDISADGKSATFHFTQSALDGKTKDDIKSGYMGVYTNPQYVHIEDYSSLTEAISKSYRKLNLSTWTLETRNYRCLIYMDPSTTKTVVVEYYDIYLDDWTTVTLEKGHAYHVDTDLEVTVEGESKILKEGKLYYVK